MIEGCWKVGKFCYNSVVEGSSAVWWMVDFEREFLSLMNGEFRRRIMKFDQSVFPPVQLWIVSFIYWFQLVFVVSYRVVTCGSEVMTFGEWRFIEEVVDLFYDYVIGCSFFVEVVRGEFWIVMEGWHQLAKGFWFWSWRRMKKCEGVCGIRLKSSVMRRLGFRFCL